jgi:HNH endonuclease
MKLGLTQEQIAFRTNAIGGYHSMTLSDVAAIVSYDSDSGIFTRRKSAPHAPVGAVCGMLHHAGYILIRVRCFRIPAHRLAWMFSHGEWPSTDVDHIDGDRSNNRIANLRLALGCGNAQNSARRKDNKTGFKGVSYFPRNRKWGAQIQSKGERLFIGLFTSPELAHAAYSAEAIRLHGEFARVS